MSFRHVPTATSVTHRAGMSYAIVKLPCNRKLLPVTQPKLIYDLIHLPVGSLTLTDTHLSRWGDELTLDLVYRYPPEEKAFRLIFKRCSSVHWTIPQQRTAGTDAAQMLTHDLGEDHHQRTARFATVLCEIIISYGELVIENR